MDGGFDLASQTCAHSEWVSWGDIQKQIQYQEWQLHYPRADLSLVPYFAELLSVAQFYHRKTGRHLNVYGDLGELFGAITHGIKLHKNNAAGSDGRMGNDMIEIKTISPRSSTDRVTVKLCGNFNKLMIVKINDRFEVAHRMIDRKKLPKRSETFARVRWDEAV